MGAEPNQEGSVWWADSGWESSVWWDDRREGGVIGLGWRRGLEFEASAIEGKEARRWPQFEPRGSSRRR